MNIKEYRIGDIAQVKGGKRLPKGMELKDYKTEHPYLRVTDFGSNGIIQEKIKYIDDAVYERISRYTISSEDIYISIAGTIGRTGIVPTILSGSNLTENAAKITNISNDVNTRYLLCFLRSATGQAEIINRAGGTSQPKLALYKIEEIPFPCPNINAQELIADIIQSYDDLIENNSRRIQLLEESAHLLYREWFVHLRFPGHEHLVAVNGLPENWHRVELESICIPKEGIQTGPFGSQLHQSDYTDDGIPVVMPKDIATHRVSLQTIARIPEQLANQLGRHCMQIGDIVYGRRGDIGRRALIGPRQDGYFCGTGCLRFRPDPAIVNPRYLFDQLGAPDTEGCIINRAKGSTMPNLSAGALKTVPILLPPKRIQDSYAEAVEPTNSLIETLAEQNQKLAQARDLILPRLMSGELSV